MPAFESMLEDSGNTFPDMSLGSLGDGPPSTAGPSSQPQSATKSRVRSDTASTPIAASKRFATPAENGEEDDQHEEPPTPMAIKTKSSAKGGVHLTLREQEKIIDSLKKENFSLKLKVHFLEERLNQLAPEHVEAAFKQNINLKIEVQSRGVELKKYKKLLLELEKELQVAQKGAGGSKAREKDLEEALVEREREIRELRRRRAVGPEDGALREAEARNAELEDHQAVLEEELESMKAAMEEKLNEIDRLKDELFQRGNVSMASDGGETRRARLERQLAVAQDTIEDLRAQHDEDQQHLAQYEEDKEILEDEVERLKLALEDSERRREAETFERSESRTQLLEEREERDALEDTLNSVRDQLAATSIELQQREDELDLKNRELDEMTMEHEVFIADAKDAWRGELAELRTQNDELRDVIAEHETELQEKNAQLEEQDNIIRQLENMFELKDEEVKANNAEITKLSQQVWDTEDELERVRVQFDRFKQESVADRESLETITAALKEKLSSTKAQLQESTALYEQCHQEILVHRAREEELGRHAEALAAELNSDREVREQLENEMDSLERQQEDEQRQHRRALEEKQAELKTALDDISRLKTLLAERDADYTTLQNALKNLEAENKRVGESHTTDRFSLELELDRLKRDLSRAEDDLSRVRAELAAREVSYREREAQLDKLHSMNRDLTAEIAVQTQARMNITEKLDSVQNSLKSTETELATQRTRVGELEQRLSKDQRALLTNETQFRDQLTERNTLLLTIYQYLDKILGVDKVQKKGATETKPFTNFAVFHDNLISKLKALSQIQLDFDKRMKEAEGRIMEQYNIVKKRLENYSKQIDNFERAVKAALETKQAWRRKYMAKEGELEALKSTNTALTTQLSSVKSSPNSRDAELRAANAKFVNSERRVVVYQNQLASAEETNAQLLEKHQMAEHKWEARVKEYENRLKAAEEKIKRERQGAKERVAELDNHVKMLQKQIEESRRHATQLSEISILIWDVHIMQNLYWPDLLL
ncbi:hypothetical protein Clacol_005753 [Clathrus columnatus]|uniref:Centrosomin N-terminal motif 1 domain-containing protein n=1 Tax=Clathrus columnatus TaxID=1419009 RepID=A0AAV5AB03_9AGAM|nr:hypothetical protein Clacol_005753 [Clathrus columnatus]